MATMTDLNTVPWNDLWERWRDLTDAERGVLRDRLHRETAEAGARLSASMAYAIEAMAALNVALKPLPSEPPDAVR